MIVLIGGPGSGKGTQGQKLASEMGGIFLSVGQMLREHFTSGPYKDKLDRGDLFPDELINPLLESKLASLPAGQEVVMDGFPRSLANVNWLEQATKQGVVELRAVIDLQISDDEAMRRLTPRGRDDDTTAGIAERLRIFHQNHQTIVSALKKGGIKVIGVDGVGSVDEVVDRINKAINNET